MAASANLILRSEKPLKVAYGSSKMEEMSLEAFHRPRPLEAPPTDYGEVVVLPATSPRMEQAVTQLAAVYDVDLAQQGTSLSIDRPEHLRRWLIANIDGDRIGVTRCQIDEDELLMPELDMVFEVTSHGWEPRELVHSEQVWQDYAQAMQANGKFIADGDNDFRFAAFTDFMAQDLEQHVATLVNVPVKQIDETLPVDRMPLYRYVPPADAIR